MRTKLTNISQKQTVNILKPLVFVCRQGITELRSDWSKPYFSNFMCFFKLKKFANAFSHSVTSFHFGKQDRVRKYRLGIFLFKVELGIVEINVLQTQIPIPPMLNQYPRNSLKQIFFLSFQFRDY